GLVASLLRTKDYARAKTLIAELDRSGPRHPMIDAIAGHVMMESGDLDGAIKRFHDGLALFPNKKQLIVDYPNALLKANRAREASQFVEGELARFPDDGPLHQIAARAYAAQAMESKQHQQQAEYYVWQGNLRNAITRLELASKAKDADFYSASAIDTRLKVLRKEYAEQQKDARNAG
ncbi:MAG: tetratricopeptide repeat protein, partial [Casimicrobiaceae bacterium]